MSNRPDTYRPIFIMTALLEDNTVVGSVKKLSRPEYMYIPSVGLAFIVWHWQCFCSDGKHISCDTDSHGCLRMSYCATTK